MFLKLQIVVDSYFHGSERLVVSVSSFWEGLGKARLLRWDVAPFLNNGLLDLPGVSSGPGADLLGDINALLGGGELRNQLGHVLAGTLGLKRTLFLGGILDNCLGFVITLLSTLLEPTTCGGTEFPRLLSTSSDRGVLLHILLGYRAHLLGPLGALGVGGVAGGFVLTLLLNLSGTFDNIVLDIMDLLLGPTLGLVLSPADLRTLDITILDQRSPADISCLVEGDLFVLDETALPEVLLALLLLLGVVVGDVGGVASLVVAMVTLDHIIVLNLLNHLDLVNTSLAVGSGRSCGHSSEAGGSITSSLTLSSGSEVLSGSPGGMISVISVVIMMVTVMVVIVGVEGEGVDKRPLVSVLHSPQLPGAEDALAANSDGEKQLVCIHVEF